MPDRVSVTTSQSWLSRLAGSIKSVVFGFVLFVVGFPLLFWNEGRSVKMARSLTEGAGIVVSVSSDAVDPVNDGKLVHVITRSSNLAKTNSSRVLDGVGDGRN